MTHGMLFISPEKHGQKVRLRLPPWQQRAYQASALQALPVLLTLQRVCSPLLRCVAALVL